VSGPLLWLMVTSSDLQARVREHFTDPQLWSGAGLLGVLLLISILKKIIFLAIIVLIALGIGIAYQNGAFDSVLDDLQNKG
jgi:hypothetical protein